MKLRIRGNSIRLRLTKSEVEQIGEGRLVEEKTVFPNNRIFSFSLLTSDKIDQLEAKFVDGTITVIIPKSTAETWAKPEEVGIYGEVGNLVITVEKDFNCLTPRSGDEDKDTFPHPKI